MPVIFRVSDHLIDPNRHVVEIMCDGLLMGTITAELESTPDRTGIRFFTRHNFKVEALRNGSVNVVNLSISKNR